MEKFNFLLCKKVNMIKISEVLNFYKEYKKEKKFNRFNLMQYFARHRLNELIKCLEDF